MSKTPHTESQDSRSDTPKQAVALQYQDIDELPVLLARGFGELASRIQDIAEENEIPVQENSSALESLSSLRVGQQIEEESFARQIARITVQLKIIRSFTCNALITIK